MGPTPKKRLGELLLEAGVIDAVQLQAALGHQRKWGGRLGQALVELKLARESDVVRTLARRLGYEVARLGDVEPHALEQALKLVPRDFAVRHNVFALSADSTSISVAMSDPTNLAVVDELRFRTGRRVKASIGGDREIAAAVRLHYPGDGGAQQVEAIALELDEVDSGAPGLDLVGDRSGDAFDAFFGSAPGHPAAPAGEPAGRPAAPRAASRTPALFELEDASGGRRRSPAGPTLGALESELEPEELTPVTLEELEEELPGEPVLATELAPLETELAPLEEELGERRQRQARPISPAEREILDALDRLARGAPPEPHLVQPTQAMAAVIRLLVRRGIVTERELVDELQRR